MCRGQTELLCRLLRSRSIPAQARANRRLPSRLPDRHRGFGQEWRRDGHQKPGNSEGLAANLTTVTKTYLSSTSILQKLSTRFQSMCLLAVQSMTLLRVDSG